jgi:hypothetical protein
MSHKTEPLTEAEIAGLMNWRGPGAYTAGAMRRVKAVVAEAVKREREACAQLCEERGKVGAGDAATKGTQ